MSYFSRPHARASSMESDAGGEHTYREQRPAHFGPDDTLKRTSNEWPPRDSGERVSAPRSSRCGRVGPPRDRNGALSRFGEDGPPRNPDDRLKRFECSSEGTTGRSSKFNHNLKPLGPPRAKSRSQSKMLTTKHWQPRQAPQALRKLTSTPSLLSGAKLTDELTRRPQYCTPQV
jgi:hypothetical protein